jgi:hypothetical protein
MRQSTILSVLPLMLLGCGLLTFEVDSEATTHIDGAGALGVLLGALEFTGLDDFDIDVENAMQDQGVAEGDLNDVHLTTFTLTGSPGDLSFIDQFAVYMSAPDLDEVLIASSSDFPEGHMVVSLDLPDVDLTPYVVSDTSSFRIEADGSAPTDDTDIAAAFTVSITATAKGACNSLSRDSGAEE